MRNTSADPRGVWATFAKAAREHAGLSQSELARRLNTDRTTIWRWENGRQRIESPDMVAAFARVTGIDVGDALAAAGLVPGAPPPEPVRVHDEERELIMSSNASPRRKALMLERLEELRERDKQRRMEDIRYLLEQGN